MSGAKVYCAALVVLVLLSAGCNGSKMKVSGQVTFSDDGSPLTVGMVVMESGTTRVSGKLDGKGNFKLGELNDGDGVPFGEYKVCIAGCRETLPSGFPGEYLIDSKFERPEHSGLTFVVKNDGPKTFDFKVDRPTKKLKLK